MKVPKAIITVIICLCLTTGIGIGACIIYKEAFLPEDNFGTEQELQSGTDSAEGTAESADTTEENTEEPKTEEADTQEDELTPYAEQALEDLEDYSNAPADNGCPYYVKVNRLRNVVTVYTLQDGYYTKPVRAMVCSVGKNNGTPTGTYRTSDKYEWRFLVGDVYGQYAYRISGHIMFHSVPYYSMDKGDLESAEYNKLGEAASLGCVRLAVTDAKWIYDNCPAGTLVTIYDSEYAGPLGKPTAEKLDLDDVRTKWDPTDPDAENPWHGNGIRILGAGSRSIERGCTFDPLAGVTAVDENGNDISDNLKVTGQLDAETVGDYQVTYSVRNHRGEVLAVDSEIRVVDTILPKIEVREQALTLNRTQASPANIQKSVWEGLQVTDGAKRLGAENIQVDGSALEEHEYGRFQLPVVAVDEAGNLSEPVMVTVYLDRKAPVIHEPSQKEFTGASEDDIRRQLLEAVWVEDDYSGVEEVSVSWVREAGDTCSVLYTARDKYGNVNSEFFYNYIISY